jgi:hypothetical protein
MLAYFPEDDLIVVVAANGRHAWVHHTLKAVARAALGLPTPTLKNVPIGEGELRRYTGVYDDGMFTIHLIERDGHLILKVDELGPPRALLYQGNHEFASASADEFRVKFLPSKGRAERFVFEWTELHSFARRIE